MASLTFTDFFKLQFKNGQILIYSVIFKAILLGKIKFKKFHGDMILVQKEQIQRSS